MKAFQLLSCASLSIALLSGLSGCSTPEEPAEHTPTLLKRAVNKGTETEVTSNINQINQMLMMVKSDNDGKPPADLAAAKAAAKVPADMWIDGVSGKPLVYDPVSGTVHREGVAPNTPPSAGTSVGNVRLPAGSGGY